VAHSLSAKKRIRQNVKRKIVNRTRAKEIKLQVRKVTEAIGERNVDKAKTEFRAAVKKIDRIVAKGSLHKNTAARKKSRLQRRINAMAGK
jgi:small subunit ribosomal protein S20